MLKYFHQEQVTTTAIGKSPHFTEDRQLTLHAFTISWYRLFCVTARNAISRTFAYTHDRCTVKEVDLLNSQYQYPCSTHSLKQTLSLLSRIKITYVSFKIFYNIIQLCILNFDVYWSFKSCRLLKTHCHGQGPCSSSLVVLAGVTGCMLCYGYSPHKWSNSPQPKQRPCTWLPLVLYSNTQCVEHKIMRLSYTSN